MQVNVIKATKHEIAMMRSLFVPGGGHLIQEPVVTM